MDSIYEEISHYKAALDAADQSSDGDLSAVALRTLIARDKVAFALAESDDVASPSAIQLLATSDRRLTNMAVKLESVVGGETLRDWRKSRSPDEKSWWWTLDEVARSRQPWINRLWTLLAVLCLLASFGLVADTFNLLRTVGENPISTAGNLLQAVLAFIAASAFTSSGRKWLINSFSRLGFKERRFQGIARFILAVVILGLTLAIRFYLPALAAGYFQREGDRYLDEGLAQSAIPAYQEASALQPYTVEPHLRLAKATEKVGDYGRAIEEYHSVIILYERQQQNRLDDAYFEAKISLAKLLILHDKDYTGVLALLEHPEEVIPKFSQENRKLYTYFWFTYLGWANLELKNYQEASVDLNAALRYREGAAARYLTGRVLEERDLEKEAIQQWTCFITILQQDQKKDKKDREQEAEVRPEWLSHAQDKQAAADRGPILTSPPCR